MRFAAVLLAALALASAALAADLPGATATAQRGTLKLVARALLNNDQQRTAELKATWLDARRRCDVVRRLRVSYQVDLVVPTGATIRRRPPARTGAVRNCAEGGPNFGFDVTARSLGMACRNGAWRPGRYSIGVHAVDLRSGLTVDAYLYRHTTKPC